MSSQTSTPNPKSKEFASGQTFEFDPRLLELLEKFGVAPAVITDDVIAEFLKDEPDARKLIHDSEDIPVIQT